MQLHYLLVIVVSNVKVTSYIVCHCNICAVN